MGARQQQEQHITACGKTLDSALRYTSQHSVTSSAVAENMKVCRAHTSGCQPSMCEQAPLLQGLSALKARARVRLNPNASTNQQVHTCSACTVASLMIPTASATSSRGMRCIKSS